MTPKADNLNYKLERIDDAELKITADTKLKQNSEYSVKTDLKKFIDLKALKGILFIRLNLKPLMNLILQGHPEM